MRSQVRNLFRKVDWDGLIGDATSAALSDQPFAVPDTIIVGLFQEQALRRLAVYFCKNVPGFALNLLVIAKNRQENDPEPYGVFLKWFCGVFLHDKIEVGEGIGQARKLVRAVGRKRDMSERRKLCQEIATAYKATRTADSKRALGSAQYICSEGWKEAKAEEIYPIAYWDDRRGLYPAVALWYGKADQRTLANGLIEALRSSE